MNERLILTCIAIILILLFGCEKKIEEAKGELFVDYAENYGQGSYDFLVKSNQLSLIPERLKLIDIKNILIEESKISLETFGDYRYQCTKSGDASIYKADCEEYAYEPTDDKKITGKYSLLFNLTKDSPRIGVATSSGEKWYGLTVNKNKTEYKIEDAKIIGLPETNEHRVGQMWVKFDLNGRDFVLGCSGAQCDKLWSEFLLRTDPEKQDLNTKEYKNPSLVSGNIKVEKGSYEDGGSYTSLSLDNATFK